MLMKQNRGFALTIYQSVKMKSHGQNAVENEENASAMRKLSFINKTNQIVFDHHYSPTQIYSLKGDPIQLTLLELERLV